MGGWVAYCILVSAHGPLVLGLGTKGFGAKGLGPGLDNKSKTRPGVDKVKP